jgi:hypothetical protein
MIQLFVHGPQAALNIPKALPVSQLRKGHAKKLIEAFERTNAEISLIPLDTATELPLRQKVHDLSEYGASLIHGQSPFAQFVPVQRV